MLACADGVLRVLDGAELEAQARQAKGPLASRPTTGQPAAPLRHEVRVPCAPTALHLVANDGGESGQSVLFGTDDGRVGVVSVTRYELSDLSQQWWWIRLFLWTPLMLHRNATPVWRWLVDTERPGAAVSSLHCYDLTGDGELELIVARDDGSLDVHTTIGIADATSEDAVYRRFSYVSARVAFQMAARG